MPPDLHRMTYENLLFDIQNDILTITINRPKALNAINNPTMKELRYFFGTEGPTRSDFKGVIITGAGEKAFVAGADIKQFLGLGAGEGADLSQIGHDAYFFIENFDRPVIAAINGFALGGGLELAMACHMRIASEKARMGQPEVNLGLIPGYGGSQRLVQLVGKGKAMELLLTADMIKADEALRLGLVNHVVPVGEEIEKAKEILMKIATKGPLAITKTIKLVNAYFDKNVDGFALEVEEFGHCTTTADFREGASAFIEKRKANFIGK